MYGGRIWRAYETSQQQLDFDELRRRHALSKSLNYKTSQQERPTIENVNVLYNTCRRFNRTTAPTAVDYAASNHDIAVVVSIQHRNFSDQLPPGWPFIEFPNDNGESEDEYKWGARKPAIHYKSCPTLTMAPMRERLEQDFPLADLRKVAASAPFNFEKPRTYCKAKLCEMMAGVLASALREGRADDYDEAVSCLNGKYIQRRPADDAHPKSYFDEESNVLRACRDYRPFRPLSSFVDSNRLLQLCRVVISPIVQYRPIRPLIQGEHLSPVIPLSLFAKYPTVDLEFDVPPALTVAESKSAFNGKSSVYLTVFKVTSHIKQQALATHLLDEAASVQTLLSAPHWTHHGDNHEKREQELDAIRKRKDTIMDKFEQRAPIHLAASEIRPAWVRCLKVFVDGQCLTRAHEAKGYRLIEVPQATSKINLTFETCSPTALNYYCVQLMRFTLDTKEYSRLYGEPTPILPNGRAFIDKTVVASRHFGRAQPDGSIESLCFSLNLRCPISHMRMTLPVRDSRCTHLQCFDYRSLQIIRVNNGAYGYDFRCPSCGENSHASHLVGDGYVYDILQRTGPEITEVQVDPKTGEWQPIKSSVDHAVEEQVPKIPRLSEAAEITNEANAYVANTVDLDDYEATPMPNNWGNTPMNAIVIG